MNMRHISVFVAGLIMLGSITSWGCAAPISTGDDPLETGSPGAEETSAMTQGLHDDLEFVELMGLDGLADEIVIVFDEINGLMRPLVFIDAAGESYAWHDERELIVQALRAKLATDAEHRALVQEFLNTPAGQAWSGASMQVSNSIDTEIMAGVMEVRFEEMEEHEIEEEVVSIQESAIRALIATEFPLIESTINILGTQKMIDALAASDARGDLAGELVEDGQELRSRLDRQQEGIEALFAQLSQGQIPPDLHSPMVSALLVRFAFVPREHRDDVIAFLESDAGQWVWTSAHAAIAESMEAVALSRVAHYERLAALRAQSDGSWEGASRALRDESGPLPCRVQDWSCFGRATTRCDEATYISTHPYRTPAYRYETVQAGEGRCEVRIEVLFHNASELIGEAMTCDLPAGDDAEAAFESIRDAVENGTAPASACTGSLATGLTEQ